MAVCCWVGPQGRRAPNPPPRHLQTPPGPQGCGCPVEGFGGPRWSRSELRLASPVFPPTPAQLDQCSPMRCPAGWTGRQDPMAMSCAPSLNPRTSQRRPSPWRFSSFCSLRESFTPSTAPVAIPHSQCPGPSTALKPPSPLVLPLQLHLASHHHWPAPPQLLLHHAHTSLCPCFWAGKT